MSMHKKPVTPVEEAGLKAHGLGRYIGQPSQLADVFRQGVAWGISSMQEELDQVKQELQKLKGEL